MSLDFDATLWYNVANILPHTYEDTHICSSENCRHSHQCSSCGGDRFRVRSSEQGFVGRRRFREDDSGLVDFPGYTALYIAQEKGFFREAGVNVEMKKYVSLAELSQDYAAGLMDGRVNLAYETVRETMNGLRQSIVAVIDHSAGADGILGRGTTKTVSDIKGKRVAFEAGTIEEYFLSSVLKNESLSIADVSAVNADPEQAALMIQNKEVDVAVTYEPFLSPARKDPDIHLIASSAETPELLADVLTFRQEYIDQHPETIRAFLQAYFKAHEYMRAHPEEATTTLGKVLGVSNADAMEQLRGVRIHDWTENVSAFQPGGLSGSMYGSLDDIRQFISVSETRAGNLNTDTIIDPSFVRDSHSNLATTNNS